MEKRLFTFRKDMYHNVSIVYGLTIFTFFYAKNLANFKKKITDFYFSDELNTLAHQSLTEMAL